MTEVISGFPADGTNIRLPNRKFTLFIVAADINYLNNYQTSLTILVFLVHNHALIKTGIFWCFVHIRFILYVTSLNTNL